MARTRLVMNVSSDYVRSKLKVFDRFLSRVSKKALLRDTRFYLPTQLYIDHLVREARDHMAHILEVSIDELENEHTRSNGRFDCDNYAALGCAIVKAIHHKERIARPSTYGEIAIWPMARSDIDHTQAICLTDKDWYFIEFITGETWSIEEFKPEILLVG